MLVDYSNQAYILSCNDTDYSFFGSLNYQQTGVLVEGIADTTEMATSCTIFVCTWKNDFFVENM